VAPFISTVTEVEDPERNSVKIMNRLLWENLLKRNDYEFHTQSQFMALVNRAQLTDRYEAFEKIWIEEHRADTEFLKELQQLSSYDLLLIPSVYLWWKDEADYREVNTVSSTQVGANLSLVDFRSGRIVWEATDENYKESVRAEGDRVRVETGGIHRRVSGVSESGSDMYAAPPYEDVAVMVIEVLVGAIPQRGVATR
jgi:hypothetical protein